MISCPHCGADFQPPKKQKRSTPQHNRFFALIDAAFYQWPHQHEFRPDNPEHLRKWLICAANFRTARLVRIPDMNDTSQVLVFSTVLETAVREAGEYSFMRPSPDGQNMAVVSAKSIAHNVMGSQEFGLVVDAVSEIIEQVIGVSIDQLKKEKAA